MATIKYVLQSKSENAPIYLRLSLSRTKAFKRKTGLFVDPKNWDYVDGMPKKKNDATIKKLRLDLDKLKTGIMEKVFNTPESEIDGDWLFGQIETYFGRISPTAESNLLTDHIQYIIDSAETKRLKNGKIGLSLNRVKSYKTFKNTIIEYQTVLNKKIDFMDIDRLFGRKLADWLLNNKKFSHNYAGKIIDNLKAVCQDAEIYRKRVNPEAKHIDTFSEKKDDRHVITLSLNELDKIENLDLDDPDLINTRKWLLLGCELGQRGGDLLNFTSENIRTRNGNQFIDIKQQKTGKTVTIGVTPKIKKFIDQGLPYKITDKKFNNQLRKLCLLADLTTPVQGKAVPDNHNRKVLGWYPKWKLISSHVCRRSFATNYYKLMPTPYLMSITGHSKESLFNAYIGKPEDKDQNAMQMIKMFEVLEAQRLKEKEQNNLKIV